jgi:hypothetical protein
VKLVLQRQQESVLSTQGELTAEQGHLCFTLERPGEQFPTEFHRIPAGKYSILIYPSPHFQRLMPLLAVPGHVGIEIHWGNIPGASQGCILVGLENGEDAIFHTRDAFDFLFPPIENAVHAEGCSIEVLDVERADSAQWPNG